MTKIIMITGATDGIGLETAKLLAPKGHHLLIHGRNPKKLRSVKSVLSSLRGAGQVDILEADFSDLEAVKSLAQRILKTHDRIDVLINNAGVYKTSKPRTADGYDLRFAVNLFAPYILTRDLISIIPTSGRVVNLSSAAQSPVNIEALKGQAKLGDMPAYAQSKLALTMWTRFEAEAHPDGPLFVSVNPGSLLNTNMVKEGWGGSDNDVGIGADILVRAALSPEFNGHSGDYFDNDRGSFGPPHPDALDDEKTQSVINALKHTVRDL